MNWVFLKKHASDAEVKKMTSSMKVWGLGFSSYVIKDYVELDLYFSANHDRTAVIHCEIYIIDDLKVNVLIKTDILVSEQIDVLLSQQKAVMKSCKSI